MALSRDSEKRAKQLANLKPFTGEDDPRRGVGKKRLPITEALQKLFDDPDFARQYAISASKHAKNGSGTHFKEINDRVEGPTKQVHEIGVTDDFAALISSIRERATNGDGS